MMVRKFEVVSIGVVLMLVLVACRSEPATPTPTAIPAMPGKMNLVAGCNARDVDNWTEAGGYLVEAFTNLMDRAAGAAASDLEPILEEMRVYKASIDALTVPADCVQEVHQLVTIMVAEVINTFEAKRSDPNLDIGPVVTRARATVQLVQARIADLTANMEATYQAQSP